MTWYGDVLIMDVLSCPCEEEKRVRKPIIKRAEARKNETKFIMDW